jgi:hypothetical protein
LVLGTIFVAGFLVDYSVKMNWTADPIGRHLVAMSANVGAFFLLYLALAIWPQFPGRNVIRFLLLIAIVTNCGVRWLLFRREYRAARRLAAQEADLP